MLWKSRNFYPHLSQGWLIPRGLPTLQDGIQCRFFRTNVTHGNCKYRVAQSLPHIRRSTENSSLFRTAFRNRSDILSQHWTAWTSCAQTPLVVTAGKRGDFSEDWCAPYIQEYTLIADASSQMTPNSVRLSMCSSSHHCQNPVPHDATSIHPVIPYLGLMLVLFGDKNFVHSSGFRVRLCRALTQIHEFPISSCHCWNGGLCWSRKQHVYCFYKVCLPCAPNEARKRVGYIVI